MVGKVLVLLLCLPIALCISPDGPVTIERAAENRERGSGRVAVKGKELLVERHKLGCWLISRSGYRIHTAACGVCIIGSYSWTPDAVSGTPEI
jgi:hypothetical protein